MRQFEDGGEGDDPWDVEAGKVKKKNNNKNQKKQNKQILPSSLQKAHSSVSTLILFIYLFIYIETLLYCFHYHLVPL